MEDVICYAKVLDNGYLSLPEYVRKQLNIVYGDEVEIVIRKVKEKQEELENNPLYKIIGLCNEGSPDGSVEHDKYLYKEQAK